MEYYRFPRIGARDVARDATRSDSGSSPLLPVYSCVKKRPFSGRNRRTRATAPTHADEPTAHRTAPARPQKPRNSSQPPHQPRRLLMLLKCGMKCGFRRTYTRDPPVHRNLNVEDTSVGNSY